MSAPRWQMKSCLIAIRPSPAMPTMCMKCAKLPVAPLALPVAVAAAYKRRQRSMTMTIRSLVRVLPLTLLCLSAAISEAGVLPEDRADALYHVYQGDGITVKGPAFLV